MRPWDIDIPSPEDVLAGEKCYQRMKPGSGFIARQRRFDQDNAGKPFPGNPGWGMLEE
jgi:hypothetical protein